MPDVYKLNFDKNRFISAERIENRSSVKYFVKVYQKEEREKLL